MARIVGIYPVEAREPCYLCELFVASDELEIDFGEFTQRVSERDRSSWQVAYDERRVSSSPEGDTYVFFFHYLELDRPLESLFGPLALPEPTPRPERLSSIKYEEP